MKLGTRTMLVTGGCGFMGSNFIHSLQKADPDVSVINLDALTYAGNPANLAGVDTKRYRFVRGDIADLPLVKKLMAETDAVVNFAAETHVDRSIHSTSRDFVHTNVVGVHTLLEALRGSPNVKKMILISTDEVWGDLPLVSKKKFDENSPFCPNSPYAASKAAGDFFASAYVNTYRLPIIVTHSVNNFGPRQFPEKIIPYFLLQALAGKPLPLYGDGKYVRDWVYVDDHSSAILALLQKGVPGEVYAISSGDELANIDIARKILAILDKPEALITLGKARPGHGRRSSVNSSIMRALGWKPRHSLDKKLKETIQWYADNKVWLDDILKSTAELNTHIEL